MDSKNYRVISDFDGTITIQDSNARLVEVLGDEINAQIELDFIAGKLGNKEAFIQHFQHMLITLEEYNKFLDEYIELDLGFDDFQKELRIRKIPLTIVSAGFRQGIEYILGDLRIKDVEILANNLIPNEFNHNFLAPVFAMENPPCWRSDTPCGNCKKVVIKEKRDTNPLEKIIYIGDGISDYCAAIDADLIFAKGSLATYCEKHNVDFVPFTNFREVTNYLFPENGN